MRFVDISVNEAYKLITNSGSTLKILDVRTPKEYENSHIDDALNVDFYNNKFIDKLNDLERNRSYLVYGDKEYRCKMALKVMLALGFKNSYQLSGGLKEWLKKNYPVKKPS
jgi:rhodanese-related sulfurtransferase